MWLLIPHYSDVIMSAKASQITGVSIVCSGGCSGTAHKQYQSSASPVFVRGMRGWPVDSPHKGNAEKVFIWFCHHRLLRQSVAFSEQPSMSTLATSTLDCILYHCHTSLITNTGDNLACPLELLSGVLIVWGIRVSLVLPHKSLKCNWSMHNLSISKFYRML